MTQRLKVIDSIRGIAIILVVMYHVPLLNLSGGFQGVTLFFVLSGFLISESMKKSKTNSFFTFYKKRIARIYPSLLLTIIISIFLASIIDIRMIGGIKQELLSLLFGYNNWFQLAQKTSYFDSMATSSLFKHFWSLAVELQFYLICPPLFMFLRKLSKRKIAIFLGIGILFSFILGLVMSNETRIYYGTDTRMYSFFIGIFISVYLVDFTELVKKIGKKGEIIICISMLVLTFIPFNRGFLAITSYIFSFLVAFIILKSYDKLSFSYKMLNNQILSSAGLISYEIYLIHFPIIILFLNLFKNKLNLIIVLLLLVAIVAMGIILYKLTTNFKINFIKYTSPKKLIIGFVIFLLTSICVAASPNDRLTNDQKELKTILKENSEKPIHRAEVKGSDASQDSETTETLEDEEQEKDLNGESLLIGDSVMLGALPELQNVSSNLFTVDAKESRQVWDSEEILNGFDLSKYKKVVIGLGTNGIFSKDVFDSLMDKLTDKEVYWINVKAPVTWENDVNQLIEKEAGKYQNLKIIDWKGFSSQHSDWFYDDQIHLNELGRENYGKFIKDGVLN